ncbi:hypothetical protein ACFQPP_01310 [Agrococcus sp. GCM10030265]|uniref:hypothetical protein n=1 Tax=Agrococcus sp. GCM10030265 TaxID=3273378 RepID=UPI00360BF9AD
MRPRSVRIAATIPADAEVGAHELVVLVSNVDAEVAPVVMRFSVEAAPVVVAPEAPAPVQVTPAPAGSAPAGSASSASSTSSHLPRTGADALLPMLLLSVALLGAGLAVRRRSAVAARR